MIELLTGITVGLHIASAHFPAREYHNNTNPGIYAIADGWTAGVYRNTLRRTSIYAGKQWAWDTAYGEPAVTLGVVSGYDKRTVPCGDWHRKQGWTGQCSFGVSNAKIIPMIAPSWKIKSTRIWYMPGVGNSSSVIHVSVEHKF